MTRRTDTPAIEPLLLDEHQLAAALGISFWTARELVQAGLIPTVDLPSPLNPRRRLRRKLIHRADIERFIEAHKTTSAPALRVIKGGAR